MGRRREGASGKKIIEVARRRWEKPVTFKGEDRRERVELKRVNEQLVEREVERCVLGACGLKRCC